MQKERLYEQSLQMLFLKKPESNIATNPPHPGKAPFLKRHRHLIVSKIEANYISRVVTSVKLATVVSGKGESPESQNNLKENIVLVTQ